MSFRALGARVAPLLMRTFRCNNGVAPSDFRPANRSLLTLSRSIITGQPSSLSSSMSVTTPLLSLSKTSSSSAPTIGWFGSFSARWVNSRAQKHQALLKYAKGYRGRSKNCFRIAIRRVQKAWQYAYRDRRRKKREWRKLWIMRLQAGVRQYDWKYSRFIPALKTSDVRLNRKVLADLAANEPFAFKAVVDVVENQAGYYKDR